MRVHERQQTCVGGAVPEHHEAEHTRLQPLRVGRRLGLGGGVWFWGRLDRRGMEPSTPTKMAIGMCLTGLSFSNPNRSVWEAAAAVAFTAFCAAATQINPTSATASGYRVMGHPGVAPNGYADYSYGKKLARELTANGYLP